MKRSELLQFHETTCDSARAIMVKKNQDYATEYEVFGNLRACEQMGLCSVETGILIRLADKMRRLAGFAKTGRLAVSDESARDTILDAINYLVLLAAAQEDKDGRDSRPVPHATQPAVHVDLSVPPPPGLPPKVYIHRDPPGRHRDG